MSQLLYFEKSKNKAANPVKNWRLLLLFLVSFSSLSAHGQVQQDPEGADTTAVAYDKNVLKLNLTALLFNNYELQYERMIGKKTSVTLSGRFMPYGQLPGLSTIEGLIDDPEVMTELEKLEFGNTVITSEIRFYLGKKGGPRGFYIAPYARLSNMSLGIDDFEIEDMDDTNPGPSRTVDFDGKLRALTGGLMFGSQWRLGQSVYLDWWIIGASFGNSTGSLEAIAPLSIDEQNDIRQELSDLDVPLVDYTLEVNSNGARLDFDGPFASLRGGITLGIKF